ncbi:hypothetical protein E2562_036891 [Oryza meyeriana var. granulata]|uniref:Uncharacterized protein n=1 Tax=Oryza meyeriana var. granulata TaxID=110450 RepID=A0A6G1ETG1_9ORYZ|nr:hypothetical protein E2562_036891 [Oryza meyeriana var. granulata]
MLVRSASTPVLGTLLPSGSHSPAVSSPAVHFFADSSPTVSYHPPAISCRLTPGGYDVHDRALGGLRRACSDGNLAALGASGDDHHQQLPPSGKCAPRSKPTALETIQSFTQRGGASTDDEEDDEDDEENAEQELSFGKFRFSSSSTFAQEHPLFLARGLGIDRLGSGLLSANGGGIDGCDDGGGGAGGSYLVTSDNGGNRSDIEMHYKKMIEEDPCNGLFLTNYAQFLYQIKGDHRRAEEYYSRAILADPNDGELLSEYAKLVWDVHRDEERASSYFERAAKASPQNSHVLAAHAAFLWDTDDGDGPEGSGSEALGYAGFAAAHSSLASATS